MKKLPTVVVDSSRALYFNYTLWPFVIRLGLNPGPIYRNESDHTMVGNACTKLAWGPRLHSSHGQRFIIGVCLTSDVDIFLKHMNNARYIRELDFARFDFYFRCGLYEEIMVKSKGGNAMQGASNIRYRRTIPIFNPYKIETQLVYWDDKAIYLEQRFITLTDGFVRAVALSKQNIIGVSAEEMMKTLAGTGVKKPQVPQDLDHWLKSIEASSAKLRPKSD